MGMDASRLTLREIVLRSVVVHTTTYMFVGAIALVALDYPTLFAEPWFRDFFRPINDPIVMAGPLFQPIRGVLFGVVFYLLRVSLFGTKHGWARMWIILVIVGVLSTFGAAPGSVEGLIYTTVPVSVQLGGGLLEVLVQSLLLSLGVFYWVTHPDQRWLTWGFWVTFVVTLALPALGLLVGQGLFPTTP